MACFILKLTEKERYRLGIVFSCFLVVMVFCGLFLIGYAAYVSYAVSSGLFPEYSEINYILLVQALIGIHIVFIYGIGLRIAHKCYYQPNKDSTPRLLFLWYFAAANCVLDLLAVCHATRKETQHIISSIKISMEKGISNYLKDKSWKNLIDQIQYNYECCGIDSYLDWHDMSWITKYQINDKSDLVKQLRTSHDSFTLPITPWSCCNLDFPMQCLHDPFQQTQSSYLWVDQPDLVLDSLNTKGCLSLLRVPVDYISVVLIIASVFTFLLNIAIFLASRFLYTACRNAVILQTRGRAPAWIFGRGDCGIMRGPTLIQIMGEEQSETDEQNEVTGQEPNFTDKIKNKIKSVKLFERKGKSEKPAKKKKPATPERSDEDPVPSEEESQLLL